MLLADESVKGIWRQKSSNWGRFLAIPRIPERSAIGQRVDLIVMKNTPETRASLILRLRESSDVEAWNEFAEIYQPLVYRLARQKGLQDADAQEVTQEVMTRVARAINGWEPDRKLGTFRGWLYRISKNMVIQFLRTQNRMPRTAGTPSENQIIEGKPDGGAGPDEEFDSEFERQTFAWAAKKIESGFSEKTWSAFWRTAVENETVDVVANDLQMSRGAVYIARSRVIARLRETIQRAIETD